MRLKLNLAIAIGLLSCTLATLEFPELVNLVDDTSNDYSLAVFAQSAPAAVTIKLRLNESRPALPEALSGIEYRQPVAYLSTDSSVARTTGDMIHSLCILRT
jgi:hypothetical protein